MEKPRILIVDDEESIRVALSRWFSLCGYEVDVALDGLDALEKCETGEYDVVLMDIEMPRMDGVEATRQIKIRHPSLPVVVLTGYPNRTEEIRKWGPAKILRKPFDLRSLESEVRATFGDAKR